MEKIATRAAFGEAIAELGAKYRNIMVLDADLASSTKTLKFAQAFPGRHFNIGIAEQNMMSIAAGMAIKGKIPFACTFAIFATGRAWEQIRNGIAYPNLNVKVVGSHSGIMTGEDGATHQALEDIAVMRAIPNMKVFCPADAYETKAVIASMCEDFGPVYLRLGRSAVPVLYDEKYRFKPGKGDVLRDGTDITIFAVGSTVSRALSAAEILESQGVSARVCNMCSIKPIDEDLILESARKTKKLFSVEDHQIIGGLGSAISEVLAEAGSGIPLKRIGMHKFGESGKDEDLYRKYGLDAEGIVRVVSG
ncbi:transketolase [Candidatus Peregrinibacteria bacterium CG10_big_fil_rev_8_21_14_0_10_44_7]|nr:MAG: transketolase [Candidatus Peregrinibacteria bacterium CG2_30_44_17]PIS04097.1 MAG: transketolase [Candidatus Peregrinibacteria bacterium CG10_big_fil_rev_8_21_14_0_10_44_7]PIX80458.1 MAG: transketolase [Candidatus Peregrinibacteria bacterium CG_4_10_14_3_um_filter_44_21]PJB88785.1 MAG: transketolase [Candidatus Peregrinibacteria bacterium CG_4_9_14_0_8_um_filter_44_15]